MLDSKNPAPSSANNTQPSKKLVIVKRNTGERIERSVDSLTGLSVEQIKKKVIECQSRIANLEAQIERQKRQLEKLKPTGFYASKRWKQLRFKVLLKYGRRCMLCYSESGEMHVDHIRPRSRRPDLQLQLENLQVLCRDCNLGKSNLDDTDLRG